MNKEEESENLYQQLLKRNQINADIIRKFIKKSKQYKTKEEPQQTKEYIPQYDNHLTHTKDSISLELECPTGGKCQVSFKNNSKQEDSNIYHQLSQNNSEKINKVNSRFPLINSLHSTNKIHKEHTKRKEVCLSHSYLQKQTINNCKVSETNYTHNDNEYQHEHQIEPNIIKISRSSEIGNQRHEIGNKIEDKRGSKDLKQIVNMKELKFEVPNSHEKCKENSILKSKDQNKPKQSNNLLSYSFQNKKSEYHGFYANSESGIFDTLDSIANMFDNTENTHKLNISKEGSNQQKAISSISFSAISYLFGNAGKLGINNLEEKGIEGERFFRNWREKYGLEESNRSSIMQIGDLLSLYPTKLSGTQNKRISEKTNILMANINKLKEFKLNFHQMAKQEKPHHLIPSTQGYRNISSNSVSIPMANSMHENEKGKENNEIKFKNIGHIFNKI